MLLSALPVSIVGFCSEPRIRELTVPALGFLVLISGLGHKEWRFVVYVVPLFNIAAARGAMWMCVPFLFHACCYLTNERVS